MKLPNVVICYLVMLFMLFSSGCSHNDKAEIAKNKSEMLLKHIKEGGGVEEFPAKYFPPDRVAPTLLVLRDSCGFDKTDGKLVSTIRQSQIGAPDAVTFRYQYNFSCNISQIAITYLLGDTVELYSFKYIPKM